MFISFITNKIVVSVFFSIILAQIIKAIIAWRQNHEFHWRYLFISAGMPSAHTATVTALTAAVFWLEGFSTLAIVVLGFSLIIIRDVLGDKVFAQKQENFVNKAIENLVKGDFEKIEWQSLIGHTVKEVVAGFLLGAVVTVGIFMI